jgi:hypothetical protein
MSSAPGSAAGTDWTLEEINAAVDTWANMLKLQQEGETFS